MKKYVFPASFIIVMVVLVLGVVYEPTDPLDDALAEFHNELLDNCSSLIDERKSSCIREAKEKCRSKIKGLDEKYWDQLDYCKPESTKGLSKIKKMRKRLEKIKQERLEQERLNKTKQE